VRENFVVKLPRGVALKAVDASLSAEMRLRPINGYRRVEIIPCASGFLVETYVVLDMA
jgi:hypothetical protein